MPHASAEAHSILSVIRIQYFVAWGSLVRTRTVLHAARDAMVNLVSELDFDHYVSSSS
jgi:hypothetical protein